MFNGDSFSYSVGDNDGVQPLGFVPGGGSPNAYGESSPTAESGRKNARSGATNQSLVPVTIKQILTAEQNGEEFRIDGRDINNVTFVGNIISLAEQATHVNFVVDDGTGKIEAKVWLENTSDTVPGSDAAPSKKGEWRERTYARIVGSIRTFSKNNVRSIIAYRVLPVRDHNEITYHFMEALHVHLTNTRGGGGAAGGVSGMPGASYASTTNFSGGAAPSFNNYGSGMNNSLDPLKSDIIQTIRSSAGPEGVTVQFVSSQLGRSMHEIREAVDWLTVEGFLYCTIDEDHFQAIQ